jgi:hypothetical protein
MESFDLRPSNQYNLVRVISSCLPDKRNTYVRLVLSEIYGIIHALCRKLHSLHNTLHYAPIFLLVLKTFLGCLIIIHVIPICLF